MANLDDENSKMQRSLENMQMLIFEKLFIHDTCKQWATD